MFKNTCSLCGLWCKKHLGVCDYCFSSISLLAIPDHGNLLARPDIAKLYPTLDADGLFACAWYQNPVANWLTGYKYHRQQYLLKSLWQLVDAQLANLEHNRNFQWPDVFTFVPCHKAKLISRGFNQVCQIWRKPLHNQRIHELIQRDKLAHVQATLKRAERQRNLQNTFSLHSNMLETVRGKRVAILDDVITTGATMNVLTKLLKQAGAAQVDVWVICVTPLHS